MKPDEKAKDTRTAEIPVLLTYQRESRKLFEAARQVFSPWQVEGTLPSSSMHRKMLSPQGVEGAFPSTSMKQVQVEQMRKGTERYKKMTWMMTKKGNFSWRSMMMSPRSMTMRSLI